MLNLEKLTYDERLVRVNADGVGKRFNVAVILVGVTIFLATFLIAGFAVPDFIQYYPPTDFECPVYILDYSGFCTDLRFESVSRWQSTVRNLTRENAFISIGANVIRNNSTAFLNRRINRNRIRFEFYFADNSAQRRRKRCKRRRRPANSLEERRQTKGRLSREHLAMQR